MINKHEIEMKIGHILQVNESLQYVILKKLDCYLYIVHVIRNDDHYYATLESVYHNNFIVQNEHAHLLNVKHVSHYKNEKLLEYDMVMGSWTSLLEQDSFTKIPLMSVKHVIRQCLSTIAALHQSNIVFADISNTDICVKGIYHRRLWRDYEALNYVNIYHQIESSVTSGRAVLLMKWIEHLNKLSIQSEDRMNQNDLLLPTIALKLTCRPIESETDKSNNILRLAHLFIFLFTQNTRYDRTILPNLQAGLRERYSESDALQIANFLEGGLNENVNMRYTAQEWLEHEFLHI